ncbi:Riboflavin synthase-like beta-barrel [Penicillium verhagenii]|uniref:Riboflavin synthase-like beta-barrel n=1 Tax=Penicillium verhagenii TaxID=1562060 RepID=UPI002545A80B|nr:Riboflavin synthase-like beta-barrel [Penicillium verhagenii]KAJ5928895.1 Riboflavin synthase-like beta-barrel [Penicillium verhagenii]
MTGPMPWHDGEEKVHHLLNAPEVDNPSTPFLSPRAGAFLQQAPLVALGTLDEKGRPWSTLWGGQAGFAGPIAESIIGLRALVDSRGDPVVRELLGNQDEMNSKYEEMAPRQGKMVSGLAIDLENRRRVKLFGRMMAGSLNDGDVAQAQLVVKIEESLGNCPKYLNKRHIVPAHFNPTILSDKPQLTQAAIDLLSRADTMFVSSSREKTDMDTNIRGGPPGFIRVESNDTSGAVLVYPEYSGNRLYQTLGNLQLNPRAGYVIPDFETGDVLYVTGDTQTLVGKDAAEILPRSNLAIRMKITAARFVRNGLAFRGEAGELSPYNPTVRYLSTEKSIPTAETAGDMTATLIKKETITPTIKRFRFRVSSPNPISWIPGQYATLSFEEELNLGYSHMRDDDPTSLNDDFIRTFTVSSSPNRDLPANEFELMIRLHGKVTDYLFHANEQARLEVPLKGFGGTFRFSMNDNTILPFVAGGIGITPLIGQLPDLALDRLRLFWSVSIHDMGLVQDLFQRWPRLAASTTLFVTGVSSDMDDRLRSFYETVKSSDAHVEQRRMQDDDLDHSLADIWYLCAGTALQQKVLTWLEGKKVMYENFNY